MCAFVLTGVDEELIGNSRVVYIVDSCSKQSSEDLQVSEDSLKITGVGRRDTQGQKNKDKFRG